MATFYLLPPRACLEDALAAVFSRYLPGLPVPADAWDVVADRLAAAAGWPADVYLVPRDDLPADQPAAEALAAGFGAEPGDRVVEVPTGPAGPRVWTVPAGVSAVAGSC